MEFIILSADLVVLGSLSLSCLVADPNQTAMDVVRTDHIIAVLKMRLVELLELMQEAQPLLDLLQDKFM